MVKSNTEEHPGVAGQMGVRSIPSVFAFDKGRPVNGFQGALPESQVRQFIDSILGGTAGAKQLQEALEQAEAAAQAGDIGTAAQLYGAVMQPRLRASPVVTWPLVIRIAHARASIQRRSRKPMIPRSDRFVLRST